MSERSDGSKRVDAYLRRLSPGMRTSLQGLRARIRAAAPRAEEVISYKMPAFRYQGMLVWYAAFGDHMSLFVGSSAVRRKFAAELRPFMSGKGTLRFTPQRPIPAGLLRRIVKTRVAENEARARAKRRRPTGSSGG